MEEFGGSGHGHQKFLDTDIFQNTDIDMSFKNNIEDIHADANRMSGKLWSMG